MNDSMYHRGPDDSGEYINLERKVSLAMRRLSIIDLVYGKQPMANENQTVWVVFNGEIYNAASLRQSLQAAGHRFASDHSDTEILLHLYEEKNYEMLTSLNGMFAFVIYDLKKNLLFGARDRVGIKPLYYTLNKGVFGFASELKTLILMPSVSRKINHQSLYDYMSFQCIPSPMTIFEDVHKLSAGCFFIYNVNSHSFKFSKYWSFPGETKKYHSIDEVSLREKLEKSVLSWSASDVPLACSLSGGIDSTALLGLLSTSGVKNIKTFSLGFSGRCEKKFDERIIARNTAKIYNSQHFETILSPDDLLKDLDKMVWHLDEPYAGGLPSWYIFKAMKAKVKVALTGTGGDELFGNYGKWIIFEQPLLKMRALLKPFLFDNSFLETRRMIKKFPQGYLYHRCIPEILKRNSIFSPEITKRLRPSEFLIQHLWDMTRADSARDKVAAVDFSLQLPEEFLHMTDRFSMAHSIEARVPFLDHSLIEEVMSIPANIRTKPGNLKYLFIETVKDLLPSSVRNGSKRGFIIPTDRWLRGLLKERVESLFAKKYLEKQAIFNPEIYDRIVRPYYKGKTYLHSVVWTIFMFQLWHKKFIENE